MDCSHTLQVLLQLMQCCVPTLVFQCHLIQEQVLMLMVCAIHIRAVSAKYESHTWAHTVDQ